MSTEYLSPEEYAEEEIGGFESYKVLVDVEGTTHHLDEAIAAAMNDYMDHKVPVVTQPVFPGDFDDWEEPTASEKLRKVLNNPEDFAYFDGFGDFPGFHTISDVIWTGNYEDFEWVEDKESSWEERYSVDMIEEDIPDQIHRLRSMDHVERVAIVTSRGNFFDNEYDVETALTQRLAEDLSSHPKISKEWVEQNIYFAPPGQSKVGFGGNEFQVFKDDSPFLWNEIKETEGKIQLARPLPHNEELEMPGKTEPFSRQVQVVENLG